MPTARVCVCVCVCVAEHELVGATWPELPCPILIIPLPPPPTSSRRPLPARHSASKLLCNGTKQPSERIMSKVCEVGGNLCQPILPILLAPTTVPAAGPSPSRFAYLDNMYQTTT